MGMNDATNRDEWDSSDARLRALADSALAALDRDRLLATAAELIGVPGPTGSAGEVADRLAALLESDGFAVERVAAGHPNAPAVVVRWTAPGAAPGGVFQFDGHLDVVPLPHAPPVIDRAAGVLRGSGACDMKGGVAAAVEALRILRARGLPRAGSVLFTAHDLHEAPWGDNSQLEALIRAGYCGDAVWIPEPLRDVLPIRGRGQGVWRAEFRRSEGPIHEVLRSEDAPSPLEAAAELVLAFARLDADLRLRGPADPVAGRDTVFVGQMHGGEIFNQFTDRAWLEGTRRWVPRSAGGDGRDAGARVGDELRAIAAGIADRAGLALDWSFRVVRDAFHLDPRDRLAETFRRLHAINGARFGWTEPIPDGPKRFVDDGNTFHALAGVPAITHGPLSGGQHTRDEWVSIDDLARVATLGAALAASFLEGA